jgi:hypothetical protein
MRAHQLGVRLASVAVIVAWVVLPMVLGSPASAGGISAEEAIAAAGRTAAALDVPFGEGATAKIETVLRGRPEWHVGFGEFSRLSVGEDGVVNGLTNYAAIEESYKHKGLPAISEAEATAIASQILTALGMTPDLRLEGADLQTSGDNIQEWVIHWQRVWQGIPYEETARAFVCLDAPTGRLTNVRLSPSPPRPATTEVKLSESEAVAVALEHVKAGGIALPEPRSTATLEIAQPDFTWTKQAASRYDDPTRVVWRVEVGKDTDPSMLKLGVPPVSVLARVQVDAATGEVVGDAITGLAAPAARPSASSGRGLGSNPLVLAGAGILLATAAVGGVLVRTYRHRAG